MIENEKFYPIPQPEEISIREREDAMGAYFMMFAAIAAGLPLPIINLIAAIIYYFVNKGKSLFVKFHALQSLISQIPTSLINASCVFWGVRIIFFGAQFSNLFKGYLVFIIILNVTYIVFCMIAAVKARKGKFFYFFFFGKLAYLQAYKINETVVKQNINLPPKL
jgi:uncharacterized Tic20 family protein